MEVEKLNVSVVVLAREHNPSILHPAFLSSQGIMPEGEELAGPPLCTPPLSVVKYKNGISFSVEKNKFQVLHEPPPKDLGSSPIPGYAGKYIQKLPHVRYTAVGINVAVLLEMERPEEYLIQKFLDRAKFDKGGMRLQSAGFRLVYPLNDLDLNLSCDPGKVEKAGGSQKKTGVIVRANYHRGLKEESDVQEVMKAISSFGEYCRHFEGKVLAGIFGD